MRADAFELKLTDRERDVMGWAARGKTVRQTVDILSISPETVEAHVKGRHLEALRRQQDARRRQGDPAGPR